MTRHYLDHASTSPPRPEVLDAMQQWFASGITADPGRVHSDGRAARESLEEARTVVARFLGTTPRQVIFTSSGTEAVNAAVFGAWRAAQSGVMVLADVEHSAVRDSSMRLAQVEHVPVDTSARMDLEALRRVLEDLDGAGRAVSLVHCQIANHEVGTMQPFQQVVDDCRQRGVLVHVDACSAVGHLRVAIDEIGADLVSVSAHKFGGPPGIGALVVRRGLRLEPLVLGGEQERARRGGFENVPAAVGLAAAASLLSDDAVLQAEAKRSRRHTSEIAGAACAVSGVTVLGDLDDRLPHVVCLAVDGVEAEPVLLGLDQVGIAVHSGSSCSSEALAPSTVLQAMGVDADHSLRVSVGWSTTDADVAAFCTAFPQVVAQLRALRP